VHGFLGPNGSSKTNGVRVFDGTVVRGPAQELCDNQCTASLARGATYPGVLLPVSALVFQRRDVP
jgi:hypothetical protein